MDIKMNIVWILVIGAVSAATPRTSMTVCASYESKVYI